MAETVTKKIQTTRHKPSTKKDSKGVVRVKSGIDRPFLIIVILLVAIGTIMVFSASYAYAKSKFEDSYFFAVRQLRWVILGTGAMLFFAYIFDYLIIKRLQKPFFYICMALIF